ncbi:MAG: PBP1A family penicillin-binding protein [Actinobacteria bacterium]|nr:PBP1A family penicillin-binding protein [Actinomycetota bacterium]
MPIPQLPKKIRSGRGWQDNRKKYYIKKPRGGGSYYGKNNYSPYKKKRRGIFPRLPAKKLAGFAFILIVAGGLFSLAAFAWLSRGLPNPNQLMDREVAQSTKILDRTGENILYEIHGEEKRTLIPLDQIPKNLKWATISIEDKNFYEHGGFSLLAILRTAATNILFRKKAGASTLTQQFIKNSVLTTEKTYTRKIKELIMAYRVEKKFTKDEILQMYFNEIPYGSTSYGVEAASRRYFGKGAKDLTLAESAILAALPQAPSRYSPYGSNKELLMERQRYILDLMVKYGHITEEEAEFAKNDEVEFKEPSENITAPHFVMYIKEILSEKYGEKMIEQGGLKIYTTLDLYKQKIAEEVIEERAQKNKDNYNASNAALISIDPKTGQVLAMVGSKDFFDEEIDGQVNITTSLRQPGSSMKPLVYAAAFVKGYTPDTVLYDVVTNFSNNPDEPYEPRNYDSAEHGAVTIRKALAGSLNIPAVKAIYLAGINNVLDLADQFGYTSLSDRDRFGLSLVLGGGEIKLIEHTNAFGVFAREGKFHPITTILKIEDKDGKVIEEFKEKKEREVLDSKVARLINDILSDNPARAYAFGENNWLTLGSRPVAAKTGTTNDYRDAWTIGYTPSIVTGVWVGNNDNSQMKRGAAGGAVAAPIWHDYMNKVLGDTPIEQFRKPEIKKTGKPVLDGQVEGNIKIKIDRASGLLATEYTPESYIIEKTFTEPHCILYYIDKNDPLGDPPKDPNADPQFDLWESRVLEWAGKQGFATSSPPAGYDNLHKPENRPDFTIESPVNKQMITEQILRAEIKASAPRGIGRAEYYIDNNLVYTNRSYPFNLEKNIYFLPNGFHNLRVKVCDDIDNCSENALEFNLILDASAGLTQGGIGVLWAELSDGMALNDIDFPLSLKVKAVNPLEIAKINFYYQAEGNGEKVLIKSHAPIDTELIEIFWTSAPADGTYKLSAEAVGWNSQLEESEEITVTVSNIESD